MGDVDDEVKTAPRPNAAVIAVIGSVAVIAGMVAAFTSWHNQDVWTALLILPQSEAQPADRVSPGAVRFGYSRALD